MTELELLILAFPKLFEPCGGYEKVLYWAIHTCFSGYQPFPKVFKATPQV